MAIGNTTNQGLPYPLASELIKDTNDHIRNLALFLEKQLVMKFADMATLGTKIPSPTAGMAAYIVADKTLMIHDGTAWKRVYPTSPMIYSGNTTPASTLGQPGDFFVQY